jgi:hypothetical protein
MSTRIEGVCRASPGLLVRGAGFQTRENTPLCKFRALALVPVELLIARSVYGVDPV